MSDASIDRILDKLSEVGERVSSLETTVRTLDSKVDKYNGVKDRTQCLEQTVKSIQDKCSNVQAAKANKIKPWIGLAFTVMGGIILILAGIVINIALKR